MDLKKAYIIFFLIYTPIAIFASMFLIPMGDRTIILFGPFLFFYLCQLSIYSQKNKDKSFISKTIYWYWENWMFPQKKYNHLLGGSLFFGLGIYSMILPFLLPEKTFDNIQPGSYEFFKIVIVGIISFISSFLFGLYVLKKYPYKEPIKENKGKEN
jgi:hypothetical protein